MALHITTGDSRYVLHVVSLVARVLIVYQQPPIMLSNSLTAARREGGGGAVGAASHCELSTL